MARSTEVITRANTFFTAAHRQAEIDNAMHDERNRHDAAMENMRMLRAMRLARDETIIVPDVKADRPRRQSPLRRPIVD